MNGGRKTRQRGRMVGVAAAIALISVLHYSTSLTQTFSHELFGRFYYLPIILAGFWFGLRGGLGASIAVTVVYFPHLWQGWGLGGAVFWDKILEVALLNLAGATVGFLADREHRQRALNHKLLTLATLGEAATSVAHEMKNIVIPINGFIRRIRETPRSDENAAVYLEIIARQAERLEAMTRDMLAFARQASVRKQDVDVRALFQRVREEVQGEFDQRGVGFSCECSDSIGRVPMDGGRIQQALQNLLLNALHASNPGSTVRLSASHNAGHVKFMVEDEGEGIPPEHLERVLQPFFTTKPHGTGLGLAITKGIALEHEGEMSLTSASGHGTKVRLVIPLA